MEELLEELYLLQEAHRKLRNLFDMGWQSEEYRLAILELQREIELLKSSIATEGFYETLQAHIDKKP